LLKLLLAGQQSEASMT